jgi:hypothetical protein
MREMTSNAAPAELFRIWITHFRRWQPETWRDLPREAVAVELAEPGCYSAADALAYIEGHNSAALGRGECRWAVAVPVTLAFEGDPAPGETIFPEKIALTPTDG